MWKALKSTKSVSQHKTMTINSRTCGTTRCVPRPRIYSPSGCRPGSSWPWHTRWESARLHNARAIFSQNLPLHSKRENRGVYGHATGLIVLHSITSVNILTKPTFWSQLISVVSLNPSGSQNTVRFLQQLSETPSPSSKVRYHQSVCADSHTVRKLADNVDDTRRQPLP